MLRKQPRPTYRGRPKPSDAHKLPILISYEYLRKMRSEDRDWLVNNGKQFGWEILLDSGAFSALNKGAVIDVDEYIEFLQSYKDAFFRYFALDVIGDSEGTMRNLERMKNAGLTPAPVHILGAGQKEMDSHFEISEFVGCGGLRRPHRGEAPLNYLHQKMKWARGRDVHWLGRTKLEDIVALTPYSVDCSSWNRGQRYGVCTFYQGRGKWVDVARSEKHKAMVTPGVQRIIDIAGFQRADLYKERSWHLDARNNITGANYFVMMCGAVSWMDYSMEIRRKLGTRLFIATYPGKCEMEALRAAWSNWRASRQKVEARYAAL